MQRDLKSELAVFFLVSERKARKREERQVGTGKEARSKRRGAKSLSDKMRERERERKMRAWLLVLLKFQERRSSGSFPRILRNRIARKE